MSIASTNKVAYVNKNGSRKINNESRLNRAVPEL